MYSAYEGASSQRLIVVANRLPVSAFKDCDGHWALQARTPHCPAGLSGARVAGRGLAGVARMASEPGAAALHAERTVTHIMLCHCAGFYLMGRQ